MNNIQITYGVPTRRPELRAPSSQSLLDQEGNECFRNLFRNLEMCFQAMRNEKVMAEAVQRAFLAKPKSPYLMRMERALCDLTNPQLTAGVFYCSVFKINEKYYARYLDSGVFSGLFINSASKLRDGGRRFSSIFETNATSFLPSHQGLMAQVSENLQTEESEHCHLVGSITCIVKKKNLKIKGSDDRFMYCTGDFSSVAADWETLLQTYRTDGFEVSILKTTVLTQNLSINSSSLSEQCRVISALSNYHYWEAEEHSNVGFGRMLSLRDSSGKYKPASPRNRILLAIREHNYSDARATFQKFLHWLKVLDDTEQATPSLPDEVEPNIASRVSSQSRGRQTRRMTIADILKNIGSINPSYETLNQAANRDLYEKFKISLTEDGVVHWRCRVNTLDVVSMNDFDLYTGTILSDKFIHMQRLKSCEMEEFRCNCELYATLLQLAAIGVPDLDYETNVDIQCCHIKFFKEHMDGFSVDMNWSSSLSRTADKVLSSTKNQTAVMELTQPSSKTRKFSIVSPEVIGFVHLTDDTILCQSGECQTNYKQAKRRQENLWSALNICPHLALMKENLSVWFHPRGTITTDTEDYDDGEEEEDFMDQPDTVSVILDVDENLPKAFDPASGLWNFPALSTHQPRDDGHVDLQTAFQKRMALADVNGVLRDHKGYLWCNAAGPLSFTPSLPESPECFCGALYFNAQNPDGIRSSSPRHTCVIYTVNAPVKFMVYDRCCLLDNKACRIQYTGQTDCIHFLSKSTGAGDEIGWDFVDKVMKSQITFQGYCDLMTCHYKRLNGGSASFMSVNTFLDWWFSWASNFKIDFRQQCILCKENPRMLACDGTKLGIRLRHAKVIPIEKPSSADLIDPSHRRNERAFISFRNGDLDAKEKVAAREHLMYMSSKVLGLVPDNYPPQVERQRTDHLLGNIHISCRDLCKKFCMAEYPMIVMQKLAVVLKILSTSHSLSSLVPHRFHNFLTETLELILQEENPNPSIVNDTALFSPEIRDVLLLTLRFPDVKKDFVAVLLYIIDRVKCMFDDVKEADPACPQPGTYNPPQFGCAYYFSKSGEKLRNLPVYTINSDCHNSNYDDTPTTSESICQKKFPVVSRQGTTYLFLWFDPLHYGHCYGYHMIPGSEGRKDAFASA